MEAVADMNVPRRNVWRVEVDKKEPADEPFVNVAVEIWHEHQATTLQR
jgi:hypothetical protein